MAFFSEAAPANLFPRSSTDKGNAQWVFDAAAKGWVVRSSVSDSLRCSNQPCSLLLAQRQPLKPLSCLEATQFLFQEPI